MQDTPWLVEALRATFFTAATSNLAVRRWWETVSGETSAALQVSEGPPGHASAHAELANEKALLQVVCQPGRADWNLIHATIAEGGKLSLAGRGELRSSLNRFLAGLEKWLPDSPAHNRFAIGCVLRLPVKTKSEGYARLQQYLPSVQLDADGSSDFSYQINRPRLSATSPFPLKINRLSKWSVTTLHVQIAEQSEVPKLPTSASSLYCRLELDLNTAADNMALFDAKTSAALLREIENLAIEIAEKGDIP